MSALESYGWDQDWAQVFAEVTGAGGPDDAVASPGRVVRHDGSRLQVATVNGIDQLVMRIDEPVAVGDWVVVSDDAVTDVLPRRSLLRRRDPDRGVEQMLAANIDLVGVVCGLDRPVKDGRIQRATLLAHDAGATPLVILTKADLAADADQAVADVEAGSPGIDVVLVSIPTGEGVEALSERLVGKTVVLIGESGAGKSTLTNALIGDEIAETGEVRPGDFKGRHTTTSRELYVLPSGGVIIDSPGIRSVGVWGDAAAVAASFTDITELEEFCRFDDCWHETEPGCAVRAAVEAGTLSQARLDAWLSLAIEAAEAEEAAEIAARRSARRSR